MEGIANVNGGVGVRGFGGTGNTAGVFGEADNSGGSGVYGHSSNGGAGVFGSSPLHYGVTGQSTSFKWKKGDDDGTQLGLIAQEVQKIVPEVVRKDSSHHPDGADGMLSLNYVGLVPVLAKAIQEQQRIIEQQSARLSTLEQDRAPKTASLLGGGSGMGLALGLLPLGLVIAARRRKQRGG